jgi:hypothetical protein
MQGLRKLLTSLTATVAAKATLASPALTGVPTAPTAAAGTNTTQVATTAFVVAQSSGYRAPAANAALVLASTDSVIKLQSTSTADIVVTMTATHAGHKVWAFLDVCSSTGSYAFAANQGGVVGAATLAAATDGVLLVYSGTAWEVVDLMGAAAWA